GLRRNRRRTGYASGELESADVVRIAANYLLAGCRTAGSVPDSVRRRYWSLLSSLQFSAANGRTLATDDARGARQVPPRLPRTLRPIRAAGCQADGVSAVYLT